MPMRFLPVVLDNLTTCGIFRILNIIVGLCHVYMHRTISSCDVVFIIIVVVVVIIFAQKHSSL